ncbi:MAG: HAMP domain-containing sensor histidine kinase [Pseudomonadota bacterium]
MELTTHLLAETGLAQLIIFRRDGEIVRSDGNLIGELPVGESLFEHLPVIQGFETVFEETMPDDDPISLSGVCLPNSPPLECFDFSMRSHPDGEDMVMIVSRNAALSGYAAEQMVARRKARVAEDQLIRERARFAYIYENTPVCAFAHDGHGNIRAMTGELRRWLGSELDPIGWIKKTFPEVTTRQSLLAPEQHKQRMAVVRSHCRIALVDVTSLRVPGEHGQHEYLLVLDDVTERAALINAMIRHRNSLETTGAELTTSNRRLEQFAYVAAHDLLGPLGRMSTFSEIIELELGEEATGIVATAISAIRTSAVESLGLVNDLLTLAKLSHSTPMAEPIKLADVFRSLMSQLPDASNMTLACNQDLAVQADPRLLRLVARNLVGNSYKYHRPEAPLQISVTVQSDKDGGWTLSVADNGSGFHSHQSDPFKAFARMREHVKEEGIGLGLAMVKDAAEAMGWQPGISSVRGEGTCVSFRGVHLLQDADDNQRIEINR